MFKQVYLDSQANPCFTRFITVYKKKLNKLTIFSDNALHRTCIRILKIKTKESFECIIFSEVCMRISPNVMHSHAFFVNISKVLTLARNEEVPERNTNLFQGHSFMAS